jgi:hypothetical protein
MQLVLGAGYDKSKPSNTLAVQCISFDRIDSAPGINVASLELTQVKDRKSLYKEMGMSASLDASVSFYSGSASAVSDYNVSFSDTSITWLAKVAIEFGSSTPRHPTGLPRLAAMSVSELRNTCGTDIVLQETKGVLAAILYSFDTVTSEEKRALEAAISASAGIFGGGGAMNADYKAAVEQASRHSALHVAIHAQGGPGKVLLAAATNSNSDLSSVKNALTEYINRSNAENAKPLRYVIGPVSQFGYSLSSGIKRLILF